MYPNENEPVKEPIEEPYPDVGEEVENIEGKVLEIIKRTPLFKEVLELLKKYEEKNPR